VSGRQAVRVFLPNTKALAACHDFKFAPAAAVSSRSARKVPDARHLIARPAVVFDQSRFDDDL
jgi:hypothetical protein